MNISCFLSSLTTTNWISLGREQKRDIWGTFSDVFINQTTTKIVEKVLRLIVNETIILHFDWNCVFVLRQQRFKTCRKFQVWWTEVLNKHQRELRLWAFIGKKKTRSDRHYSNVFLVSEHEKSPNTRPWFILAVRHFSVLFLKGSCWVSNSVFDSNWSIFDIWIFWIFILDCRNYVEIKDLSNKIVSKVFSE